MITQSLLILIADIINKHSPNFSAVVPKVRHSYVQQVGMKLITTSCFVITITRVHRYKKRRQWIIYELDMEKVIAKASHRDQNFAERIEKEELTYIDVEMIIRRASYQSLRLELSAQPKEKKSNTKKTK